MNDLDQIMIEITPSLPKIIGSKRNRPSPANLYKDDKITANQFDAAEHLKVSHFLTEVVDHPIRKTELSNALLQRYARWRWICKRDAIDPESVIHILTRNATIEDAAYYFEKAQSFIMLNLIRALKAYARLYLDQTLENVLEVNKSFTRYLMTPSEIKALRKSKNMSISDMAEYLGCNQRFVRQLEAPKYKHSHRIPSEATLKKLEILKNG